MTYFHGSGRPHKVGSILRARRNSGHISGLVCKAFQDFEVGPQGMPKRLDSYRIENVFEKYRPEHMYSRLFSIFMVQDPRLVALSGGSWHFIYEVEPVDPQRHHWGWMRLATMTGQRQRRGNFRECLKKVERYAKEYWADRKPPPAFAGKSRTTYEWLSPRVRIVRVVFDWRRHAGLSLREVMKRGS